MEIAIPKKFDQFEIRTKAGVEDPALGQTFASL